MCCVFSTGVSIPILCPLALPNKAVGLESQIGSWLAAYLEPTLLLAQLHKPRASNHHRCMKPKKQGPQSSCLRLETHGKLTAPAQSTSGWMQVKQPSPNRGVRDGVSLDIPSPKTSFKPEPPQAEVRVLLPVSGVSGFVVGGIDLRNIGTLCRRKPDRTSAFDRRVGLIYGPSQ